MLLILYKTFAQVANISPDYGTEHLLDADKLNSLHDDVSAQLEQKFRQSSRNDHLYPALKKLEEVNIIDLREKDDNNFQVRCRTWIPPFVHFMTIDVILQDGTPNQPELTQPTIAEVLREICGDTEWRTKRFLTRARELKFFTASQINRDWELERGQRYDELRDFAMPVFDWMIKWLFQINFREQEDDPVLLSWVIGDVCDMYKKTLKRTLGVFCTLSIFNVDYNGRIDRGPAMCIDIEKWLNGDDQRPPQHEPSRQRIASVRIDTSLSRQAPHGQSNIPTTGQQTEPSDSSQTARTRTSQQSQELQCECHVGSICTSVCLEPSTHFRRSSPMRQLQTPAVQRSRRSVRYPILHCPLEQYPEAGRL